MKREKIVQTAGRKALEDFAFDFAHYNDDVLFGEVWNDPTLTPRERSMIVLSIFMGRGLADSSLEHHIQFAKENGLTKEQFAALVTQGAFYAGWPMGWALFNRGKAVFNEPQTLEEYAKTIDYPVGVPNDGFAQYFSKQSWIAPVGEGNLPIFNVTFEPGCRNNWHIHHAKSGGGQTLICVGGRGWYQEWGKEPVEMTPGTIIEIPAGVKHWHGAVDDSWFSHLAIENSGVETSNEWLEPVER
ncbi:carboxymuconolactone decarboxylase family protein [Erysipelotrichaceae bacterium 51-3]